MRTFPLFLSNRLRRALTHIDHDIAKLLLESHSDLDSRVKQTFVDIHKSKPESITFIQPNKAIQVLGLELENEEDLITKCDSVDARLSTIDDRSKIYNTYRGETRWGRFINNAFPGKFELSLGGGQNKKDIESFVNMYKSYFSRDEKFEMIEVLQGDDIAKWYHYEMYSNTGKGTLGDSCMKGSKPETFDIYTSNPNLVGLVVMFASKQRKRIKARALLWKLSKPEGRTFMDRVYTNDCSDEQVFIDLAKKNNWLYKCRQGMGSEIEIVDPETGDSKTRVMMAELEAVDHDKYPYCDTMAFYNPLTGKICNNATAYNGKYEFTDTGGGRYKMGSYQEEPVYIFSKYHNEEIDKRYARYCDIGDDWVNKDEAIYVVNASQYGSGRHYAVPGHPDVVLSTFKIPGNRVYKRYFPKNKCIWSDFLNTWIFNSGDVTGAVKIWLNTEKTEFGIDSMKRKNITFFKIGSEFYHKDIVIKEGRTRKLRK